MPCLFQSMALLGPVVAIVPQRTIWCICPQPEMLWRQLVVKQQYNISRDRALGLRPTTLVDMLVRWPHAYHSANACFCSVSITVSP